MSVKCLMLDVDGVLVNGRPIDGQPWDTYLWEDLGLRSDALVEHFFKTHWTQIIIGRNDLLSGLENALSQIAPSLSAKDLIAYWFEMDSRIMQDVLADVRKARKDGLKVYLATNQEHMRARYLMEDMGLRGDVDGIVYSADIAVKKPDREFFVQAELKSGFEPEELLLIDDTFANVRAALAAGWSAIHWDGTERLSTLLQKT